MAKGDRNPRESKTEMTVFSISLLVGRVDLLMMFLFIRIKLISNLRVSECGSHVQPRTFVTELEELSNPTLTGFAVSLTL